jgi:FAD/FMN-containing dehydrogenase
VLEGDQSPLRQCLFNAGVLWVRSLATTTEFTPAWAGDLLDFPKQTSILSAIGECCYGIDNRVPRKQISALLFTIAKLATDAGVGVTNLFRLGDGNVRTVIQFPSGLADSAAKVAALAQAIQAKCIELGGCIGGDSGIGVAKLRPMALQYGAVELAYLYAIKTCFDSESMLNPGKGIPIPESIERAE